MSSYSRYSRPMVFTRRQCSDSSGHSEQQIALEFLKSIFMTKDTLFSIVTLMINIFEKKIMSYFRDLCEECEYRKDSDRKQTS